MVTKSTAATILFQRGFSIQEARKTFHDLALYSNRYYRMEDLINANREVTK